MLKLLKWAYRRGVLHERMRIKRLASDYLRQRDSDVSLLRVQPNNERQARFEIAVQAEAAHVLERLLSVPREAVFVSNEPAPIDNDNQA